MISNNLYKTNYEGLTGKQIDELRILKREEIIARRDKELELYQNFIKIWTSKISKTPPLFFKLQLDEIKSI